MILYKYISAQRLKSIINNNQIRLTQYFDQNDPYECSLALLPIEREKEIATIDNYWGERLEMEIQMKIKYSQFGMICLTKHFNNLLMWSHYADNHKGAVIGFDTSNPFFNTEEKIYSSPPLPKEQIVDLDGFGTVRAVDYQHVRKTIKIGDYYSLHDIFFTKSIHWGYEQEYRIIKNIYGDGIETKDGNIYLSKLPKECISEIIFGLNTDRKIFNVIKKIVLKEYGSDIKLFQANLAHLTYDIEIEPIIF